MNQLIQILQHLSQRRNIEMSELLHRKTTLAVGSRNIAYWIANRVCGIDEHLINKFFKFTRELYVRNGIQKIDESIINNNQYKIELIYSLCKELNLMQEKTDGTCSPLDSLHTLSKYLPSGLRSTHLTHGKTSPTDTTDTKRPYSDTLSNTKMAKFSTTKADFLTSHTQHGMRSFSFTSDRQWARREAMRYSFVTPEEREAIYSCLCSASEWGRKCDYENEKRMAELKSLPNTVYVSMID